MRYWPIVAVVIIALVLRFWRIEVLTTFSGEEGKDFLIVRKIITQKHLTLLGPMIGPYNNVSQVFLGPAYYYLILLPLFLFNYNPIGPAIFVATLSGLTVCLVYLIGRKLFNSQIAFFSAVLYAISPTLVEQGRSSNPAYFIPIFSSILIFSILKVILDKKENYLVLVGASLGFLFQFHLTTVAAFLNTLIIFLILKPKIKIIKYSYAFFSFILVISPIIIFELRHKFFISTSILAQIRYAKNLKSSPADLLISLISSPQKLVESIITQGNNLLTIGFLFILFVSLIQIYKNNSFTKNAKAFLLIFFIWIVVNIIVVSIYSGPYVTHYYGTSLIPLIIIAMAVLYNLGLKILGKVILFSIILINLFSLGLNRNHGYSMPEGWTLKGIEKASSIIAFDEVPSKKFNVAATLDGDTRARPYRYFLDVQNKVPLDVEHYPEADIIYLISRDESEAVKNNTVWEIASFAPFDVVKKWPIQNGIWLYRLEKKT